MSSAPILSAGAATPLLGTQELIATGLTGRAREANATPEQIKKVAEDFETILLGQIVKGLRSTVPEGEDSSHTQMYRDLFDEQLAADLARKGGIGLATVIRTYLERGSEAKGEAPR